MYEGSNRSSYGRNERQMYVRFTCLPRLHAAELGLIQSGSRIAATSATFSDGSSLPHAAVL